MFLFSQKQKRHKGKRNSVLYHEWEVNVAIQPKYAQ